MTAKPDNDDTCMHCGEPVELDALHTPAGDALVDWIPCCEAARDQVGVEGWAAWRGIDNDCDCDDKAVAADLNRCTGLGARSTTTATGDDTVALWRLDLHNPGPGTRGWQSDLFADVAEHHRHHQAPVGWKFGIACYNGARRVGVAVVGRPVARLLAQAEPGTLEITRVCTWGRAAQRRNAASKLYGASARQALADGYDRLITYTLAGQEDGRSLVAAGFVPVAITRGGSWHRPGRARDDRAPTCRKIRWQRDLHGRPIGCVQWSLLEVV